eukprot:COSAG06_NODE_22242_length_730_cov_0.736926_1_plen_125_part_10
MIDCLKRADSVGQAVLALLCGGTGSAGWAGAHCRDGRALFSHRRARARLQLFPIGLAVRTESPGLKSAHSSSARFPPFPPPPLAWPAPSSGHHQARKCDAAIPLDPARLDPRDSIRSFAPWAASK